MNGALADELQEAFLVERAKVEKLEAEVEALRESLRWYVRNDPMFGYLDRGVGTETPDGVQRLAARALAGTKGSK